MPKGMKSPDAKAAVDKEWEKARRVASVESGENEERDRGHSLDAPREKKRVHSAILMDICHPKNAELEPKHQIYKGRIVLRGDTVKDISGAYAVFTEQGSMSCSITITTCTVSALFKQTLQTNTANEHCKQTLPTGNSALGRSQPDVSTRYAARSARTGTAPFSGQHRCCLDARWPGPPVEESRCVTSSLPSCLFLPTRLALLSRIRPLFPA